MPRFFFTRFTLLCLFFISSTSCLLVNSLLVHIYFLLQLTQILYCCSNLLLTIMYNIISLFVLQWPLYVFYVQPKIYIYIHYILLFREYIDM